MSVIIVNCFSFRWVGAVQYTNVTIALSNYCFGTFYLAFLLPYVFFSAPPQQPSVPFSSVKFTSYNDTACCLASLIYVQHRQACLCRCHTESWSHVNHHASAFAPHLHFFLLLLLPTSSCSVLEDCMTTAWLLHVSHSTTIYYCSFNLSMFIYTNPSFPPFFLRISYSTYFSPFLK
jgi:hypothetical protein